MDEYALIHMRQVQIGKKQDLKLSALVETCPRKTTGKHAGVRPTLSEGFHWTAVICGVDHVSMLRWRCDYVPKRAHVRIAIIRAKYLFGKTETTLTVGKFGQRRRTAVDQHLRQAVVYWNHLDVHALRQLGGENSVGENVKILMCAVGYSK